MNTNIRIELSDADRVRYKEVFGERPTRKNIKARVQRLWEKEFNGGEVPEEPPVKKKKFVLRRK